MTLPQDLYSQIAQSLEASPGVTSGQMFGKRSLSVNGNAFAAFHLDRMVFKLADGAHQSALALAGAELWDPSGAGRPMKAWVAVPAAHGAEWPELAKAALDLNRSLPAKHSSKK